MRLCYSIVMFMALIMLTAGVSVISGCGKKGPLYHPEDIKQSTAKTQKTKPKNQP